MASVPATALAEFAKFQAFSRGLLILCGRVVTAFAFTTLQNYVIARHY
jgi:hypothetical protein